MHPPKKRFAMRDLARELGLAPSTVSRALSNDASISAATKRRVQERAQELHYQPNHLAAPLRKGRSQTLGLLVPHLTGYFFPAVLASIVQAASEAGYRVLMCQSGEDPGRERQYIATLLAAQVEGVLLAVAATTRTEWQHLAQVRDQGIPLVFFDRRPELPNSTAVVLDDFQGAYRAVTHLIEQGCRRIAHLAGPQHFSAHKHCYLGYQQALRAHGFSLDERWVYPLTATSLEAGRRGMKQLLRLAAPPDAVFAAHALPAAGALEVMRARGLRVPQDVALVCVGNEPFTAMTQPRLTVVDQCAKQMGELSVRLLLQMLQKGPTHAPPHLLLPPKLCIRESSLHLTHVQPLAASVALGLSTESLLERRLL